MDEPLNAMAMSRGRTGGRQTEEGETVAQTGLKQLQYIYISFPFS